MSEQILDKLEGQELVPTAPVRPEAPTFAALGARPETVEALAAAGITRAFAIQEYAIPIALRGTDMIGQAPTGTGKTLGFGVPLLERLLAPGEGSDGVPQALVVVPTRELGIQVAKDLAAAGRTRGVRVLPIYGGVAYEPQIDALRKGVEILVGTPGRLMDLQKQKHLRLDRVRALVLDEADRMLDLGFLDDVEKILAMLPEDRQTMLFSATMPDPIVTLSRRFLRRPVTIHAGHTAETGPSPQTQQLAYRTHSMNKIEIVARILQAEGRGLTMIFTRTKRAADRVAEDLDFRGFAVAAVHGDLGQGARERRYARSGPARSTLWSPRTWPPGASTSAASPTSSTTTAPKTRTPTPTGSVVPVGPGRQVSRSPSSTGTTCPGGGSSTRRSAWTCPSRRRPTTPPRTSTPTWTSRPR